MMKFKIKNYKFEIIIFSIFLLIGLFTFQNYGMGTDEAFQRDHSIVNYKSYISSFSSINQTLESKGYYTDIQDYPYKYYGVGIQLPLVFIENLFGFKLSNQTVYYMRHLFCFLLFFISVIFFYLILKNYIVKNKNYAILGSIFLILSPRIYGESFYNIKDTVFMSLFIINCYYILKFIKKEKLKSSDIIKLSLITALTINSRIIGGIGIFFGIVIKLFQNKTKLKPVLLEIAKIIVITIIIFIAITPASWENPITYFFDCVKFFFNYSDPNSHVILPCYYFGKVIKSTDLPFHYVLVWIYITTPLLYIILFVIGSYNNIKNLIKNKFMKCDNLILFPNLILFVMLIFLMVTKPVLYGGWRHLYFLYPIIIIDAVIGLKYLLEKFYKYKKIIYIVIIINQLGLIIWMSVNHPYQNEYFHFPFREYKYNNFENNYSRISTVEALRYIVKHDNKDIITVTTPYNDRGYNLLPKSQAKRIISYYNKGNITDYIIDDNIDGDKELEKICKPVKIKKIENIRLYTIYKCH